MKHPASRFLSQDECIALAKRAAGFAVGGGNTDIRIESTWTGNIRYAHNEITTSGDVRDHRVAVRREIEGAEYGVLGNQIDDIGLEASVRRAERVLRMLPETGGALFSEHLQPERRCMQDSLISLSLSDCDAALKSLLQTEEDYEKPKIFFDNTYTLDAERRATAVEPLIELAKRAGMVAAGYVQVSAHGRAVINTQGRSLYYPYTKAQFSVTVRDPDGVGSGWAGVDWSDWTRIDTTTLSNIALEKCKRSRNPVAVEPGRYTVILEPQAVCDITSKMMAALDRITAEKNEGAFALKKGQSKIGQRIMDERITISADPMDPDLGFPPFSGSGEVYHPATWVTKGILANLPYSRSYAIHELGKNTGLPNSGSFRMSGGTSTIAQMTAATKRGLLVTRFSDVTQVDPNSMLMTGYTRDGIWLIENGQIVKPVKNFRFVESPLFMLNNVEDLGVPVRTFHPDAPVVVPPIKARDFNFASLSEAI